MHFTVDRIIGADTIFIFFVSNFLFRFLLSDLYVLIILINAYFICCIYEMQFSKVLRTSDALNIHGDAARRFI